jgi:MFS family permease
MNEPLIAEHPAGAAAPAGYDDPRRWWILAACCLVGFAKLAEPRLLLIELDIPVSAFGIAAEEYRFFTNLGVVVFVACQLMGGVFGDLFGRRRVFLFGAIGFTAANVLSLIALSLPGLIAMRTLIGVMGALVFPLTIGIIRLTFADRERSNALLIYTLATSLGTLAGLAAVPIEALIGWRWVLALPIATGMAGVVLAWRYLPESKAHGGFGRRDALTTSAWTLVFLLVIFGASVARASGGWLNPITLAAGGAGLLGLGVLLIKPQPTLQKGRFSAAEPPPPHFLLMLVLVSATLSFAMSGYALQLFGFFTTVQQLPALLGGIALAPILAVAVIAFRWTARFAYQKPGRLVVAAGLGSMALAMGLTALARPSVPYALLVPPMMLFGLGFLLASTAWSNLFLSALPADLVGVSSGINKAAGLVGGALAGVVLGGVAQFAGLNDFAGRISNLGISPELQARALEALDEALRTQIQLTEDDPLVIVRLTLLSLYRESYSVGTASALLAGAALCVVTGALAWVWLRPRL